MISTGQILAAGAITAGAVAVSAAAVRWRPLPLAAAAVLAFVLIVVWRGISNLIGLNGDYVPAVSVGDTVCLVAGALGPAAVAVGQRLPALRRWLPAVAGGVIGFAVNVLIL
ncbi:MAG TPA: hypothetical protein VKF59_14120 [Candidatus Dormibacteraeota bacterium]|nr:hypothetical protein [Candidatus Dormibacteraeota bacterium]